MRRATLCDIFGAMLDLPTRDEVEQAPDACRREAVPMDELRDAANPDQVLIAKHTLI
jgi:hypothetical protein